MYMPNLVFNLFFYYRNRAGAGYKRKFHSEQTQNKSENEVRNLLGHPPSKKYVIVTEIDEPKKICVICNAWMNYHQKLFFWPPYVNQKTLIEYLLKIEKPSKNWTSYQLHTIYGEHGKHKVPTSCVFNKN